MRLTAVDYGVAIQKFRCARTLFIIGCVNVFVGGIGLLIEMLFLDTLHPYIRLPLFAVMLGASAILWWIAAMAQLLILDTILSGAQRVTDRNATHQSMPHSKICSDKTGQY